MYVHRLRTNSSLVVPLLLALHSTTRAMKPAMAAVSNTPPMKPPVAAPVPAPAQPTTSSTITPVGGNDGWIFLIF